MADIRAGGCLCGGVRFEITAEPTWVGHCHCGMCRRAHGGPFVTWITVPASGFRLTRGALKTYASSPKATRRFCPDCGTNILFQYNHKLESVDVAAATLDDAAFARPQEHVWWEDRVSFLAMDDGLPHRPPVPDSDG